MRHMSLSADTEVRPLTPGTIVPVAGVSFQQSNVRSVAIGDAVILTHDQSNPYDRDAVAITTLDGRPLGHVPGAQRLNSRLLVGHRGGVWGGYVVDRLEGGETVGLRVQIVKLLRHNPVGFGADAPGVRSNGRDPDDELLNAPAAAVGVHEPARTPGQGDTTAPQADAHTETQLPQVADVDYPTMVYTAGSGRLLGEFVDEQARRVRVRTPQGAITSYPAAVVDIVEPAATQNRNENADADRGGEAPVSALSDAADLVTPAAQ